MTQPSPPWSHPLALSELSSRAARDVTVEPGAEARKALAQELGIQAIRKLRLAGRMTPTGKQDWRLDATLGASVVQDCVVTLEPVTSRIDEPVERVFTTAPVGGDIPGEIEMPEDTAPEPLTDPIDLGAVMAEALTLALPPFPRKSEAELGEAVFAEPGVEPMRDEDARPFAGLSGLRDRLENGGGDGTG